MRPSRFTAEQIIGMLKEQRAGAQPRTPPLREPVSLQESSRGRRRSNAADLSPR